jgi:hypothetical protein
MSGIVVRAVEDHGEVGKFDYCVDVVESVRLVEADTLIREIEADMLMIVSADVDEDALYRLTVEQKVGELEWANGVYTLTKDTGVGDISDGALMWVGTGSDVQACGFYDNSDDTVMLDNSGTYDDDNVYIRYNITTARLGCILPLFAGVRVRVRLLSDNGHDVRILFCKRCA